VEPDSSAANHPRPWLPTTISCSTAGISPAMVQRSKTAAGRPCWTTS
jgi:hypothetical protein